MIQVPEPYPELRGLGVSCIVGLPDSSQVRWHPKSGEVLLVPAGLWLCDSLCHLRVQHCGQYRGNLEWQVAGFSAQMVDQPEECVVTLQVWLVLQAAVSLSLYLTASLPRSYVG